MTKLQILIVPLHCSWLITDMFMSGFVAITVLLLCHVFLLMTHKWPCICRAFTDGDSKVPGCSNNAGGCNSGMGFTYFRGKKWPTHVNFYPYWSSFRGDCFVCYHDEALVHGI